MSTRRRRPTSSARSRRVRSAAPIRSRAPSSQRGTRSRCSCSPTPATEPDLSEPKRVLSVSECRKRHREAHKTPRNYLHKLQKVLEQSRALRTQHRLGMKLHPLDRQIPVDDSHHDAVVRARGDLELLGPLQPLRYRKRVVASRLEALGESPENPLATVGDGRGLAVHRANGGSLDAAPERGPYALMPEADAQ